VDGHFFPENGETVDRTLERTYGKFDLTSRQGVFPRTAADDEQSVDDFQGGGAGGFRPWLNPWHGQSHPGRRKKVAGAFPILWISSRKTFGGIQLRSIQRETGPRGIIEHGPSKTSVCFRRKFGC